MYVINVGVFLGDFNLERLSERFYPDTYFAGQWVCTSPHVLFWLEGDTQIKAIQKLLWQKMGCLCQNRTNFLSAHAVKKREHFCLMAAQNPETHLYTQGNHVVRVLMLRLTSEPLEF